jgi:hypothetical protein
MSELARRTSSTSSNTRVVLVRQPMRNVGPGSDGNPLAIRLAIGVIAALGSLVLLWLIGQIGFHRGFVPLLGVGEMDHPAGGAMLTTASMLINMPRTILQAGIAEPIWLMIGFAAIAIPAGAISAVRPASPGGPKPHVLTIVFSYSSAVFAALFSLAVVWWVVSPVRHALVAMIPATPDQAAAWLSSLHLAAGADELAVIAMSLWVVLVMQLTIPRWLRGLVGTACFATLAIALTAMAISNVSVSQFTMPRAIVAADASETDMMLLGRAGERIITLHVEDGTVVMRNITPPQSMHIVDQQSIAAMLAAHRE